jgi:hypothetical protein
MVSPRVKEAYMIKIWKCDELAKEVFKNSSYQRFLNPLN